MWRKTRKPNSGSFCVGTDPNRNFATGWGGKISNKFGKKIHLRHVVGTLPNLPISVAILLTYLTGVFKPLVNLRQYGSCTDFIFGTMHLCMLSSRVKFLQGKSPHTR